VDEGLRDFVSEVVGSEFLNGGDAATATELCVIDFDPVAGPPPFAELWSRDYLFLVDPRDLTAFSQQTQGKPVCMLLKPVARPAFEEFLENYRRRRSGASDQQAEAFRSDRDELLQHLLEASLKLQQHDQEKINFLARAIHDMRTPLTSLRGICGLLLEGGVGPLNPQQRELLQRMKSSAGRLGRTSSGMFELGVQGRVHRALQLEPGDIEACVNRAFEEVCAPLEEKQLQVTSRIAAPKAAMYMESQQIEQLLINLLENACRFTPRQGTIDIHGYTVAWDFEHSTPKSSAEVHNAYRIDLKDSGPSIAPSMLEAIFEQHTSIAGGEDRSGGGLSLAICKLAVTAHGGRIWATSASDGATFSVVLPFDPRETIACPHRLAAEDRPRSAQAV
jgi:signal transduction histidine kinase